MEKIKIAIKGNRIALLGNIELVAGTVGQPCEFYFDDAWKSLQKVITYKLGSNIIGSYDIIDNKTTIPEQVLKTAGLPLSIGVVGRSDDKGFVIPTEWCPLGVVKHGAIISPSNSSDDYNEVIYDGGSV